MAEANENDLMDNTEDLLVPFDMMPDHVLLNIFLRLSYAELCNSARYATIIYL